MISCDRVFQFKTLWVESGCPEQTSTTNLPNEHAWKLQNFPDRRWKHLGNANGKSLPIHRFHERITTQTGGPAQALVVLVGLVHSLSGDPRQNAPQSISTPFNSLTSHCVLWVWRIHPLVPARSRRSRAHARAPGRRRPLFLFPPVPWLWRSGSHQFAGKCVRANVRVPAPSRGIRERDGRCKRRAWVWWSRRRWQPNSSQQVRAFLFLLPTTSANIIALHILQIY
jgi:hypothetical protein